MSGQLGNVAIIGTGGQGRVAMDVVRQMGLSTPGYVDILNVDNVGQSLHGKPIICLLEDIHSVLDPSTTAVIVAIGDAATKRSIVDGLAGQFRFANLQSPGAYVAPDVQIEPGTIINTGVAVMPGCRIGAHCKLDPGAFLGHDNLIADYVSINAAAVTGGRVTLGANSTLGFDAPEN